ncbi:hypothetical protein K040078D81_45270 [Blautia hominis]|uniref:Uncharacterized protein n=1 Tax=Blautia hominis TaxID=2025493 RepID=A0ABQ0BG14_9FIRM
MIGDDQSALLNNVEIEGSRLITAKKDQDYVELDDVKDYNVGVFTMLLAVKTGGVSIVRNLVLGTVPEDAVTIEPADTEEERKQQVLKFICAQGENVVTRTLAILETERGFSEKALRGLNYSLKGLFLLVKSKVRRNKLESAQKENWACFEYKKAYTKSKLLLIYEGKFTLSDGILIVDMFVVFIYNIVKTCNFM